ncbi:MAG: RusA family crossover junction endodeoxyribonuclease [bacterium]|nr:RusA family crossover junction endodeoxyribonuclease [bacterium]
MIEINFTIEGNHKRPTGNPLGYTRVISHMWRPDATEYMAWCEYVRACYYKQQNLKGFPIITCDKPAVLPRNPKKESPKPIQTKALARMDLVIEYANNSRPDSDNVHKGILDALWLDDKYVMAGSYESRVSPDKKGRVLVTIKIDDQK